MYIKQIKIGGFDVFAYIIGCEKTKFAAVIDPGGQADLIYETAQKDGYAIKYIINTHGHGDHTGGNQRLKELTGADIIMHVEDSHGRGEVDIHLNQEKTLRVGEIEFQVFHTPGHTRGGICLYADKNLFTGDTLFVGDSGRTDLPGGDRPALGASIKMLMDTLPDDTTVWPGHDYGPTSSSTLHWEKRNNVNAREYTYFVED
jgi:glyoxylase-like metal-dependent hydrolase (beta-lactamase superfamily II)